MPNERDILEAVPAMLRELVGPPAPVESRPDEIGGGEEDLIIRAGEHVFVVEAKSSSRTAHVNQAIETLRRAQQRLGAEPILLVAVPFMGETGRKVCREKGVSYLDLCGNAHVQASGLLLYVEGRPNKFSSRGRPASVFAPRSSRVARILLRDPHHWWKQRDLAKESGLGRGYISRIVRRLEEDGLIDGGEKQRIRPRDAGELLDAWRSEYSFDKHDALVGHVTARTGEELTGKVAKALEHCAMEYAVTGLAGAALLAPFAAYRRVTVFVKGKAQEELLQSFKFRPEERGANLWIVRPKDDGVFWDSRRVEGIQCASPLQVYIDLKDMPERAKEAAEHLRLTHLNWSTDG